jgi:phospholipid/cholesterol/gamma-HCH transport system permease protein
MNSPSEFLHFEHSDAGTILHICGEWRLAHFARIEQQLAALPMPADGAPALDLSRLQALDSAGAALLVRLLGTARTAELLARTDSLPGARHALLQTVLDALQLDQPAPPAKIWPMPVHVLAALGQSSQRFFSQLLELLGFIGLILETLLRTLLQPSRWRVTALVAQVQATGLNALPIIILLTFLIGAVVAFLGATALGRFGASIFTVALVAIAFLREFGVLLTAILLAGRTASAFTAQIGSMKANEEIDAIRALGLNPIELLVLPRVLALLITLPLLTFVAMLSGIFGGAVVCLLTLDISPALFLSILQDIPVQHFWVGMGKAPLFAFLIASIGCLEGMRVSGSAESVGAHTTSSVVRSIFGVILLNALAALFFMEMDW